MQFTAALALLVAAVGISAAPTEISKRVDAIPIGIYQGSGCNDPTNPFPVTTAYIPTDGSCFGISPIISGNTDSGLIDDRLFPSFPPGCKLVVYFDTTCTSVNNIEYTTSGRCGTFGPGKLIRSAKTVGTCA